MIKIKKKIILILLLGALSTFFAEFTSGSYPIWFSLTGLLLAYPLYTLHSILLLNIALKTKMTNITHLYLFGMIFALYESWITKVLWSGYPGQSAAQFGTFLGIAYGEFITLVLFFHPIFAFIIPVIVFQMLSEHFLKNSEVLKDSQTVIHSHKKFISKNKFLFIGIIVFIIMAAVYIVTNQGYDYISLIIIIYANFLVLSIFYLISKRLFKDEKHLFSIYSLELGKKGIFITVLLLAILYVITFFNLNPEVIPSDIMSYLSILFSYLVIILLIVKAKSFFVPDSDKSIRIKTFNFKYIIIIPTLIIIFGVVFKLLPVITVPLSVIIYLMIMIAGIILFIISLKRVLIVRK